MMLLALMAFGVGMVFARRSGGNVSDEKLASLKAAVQVQNPKPEAWLDYAKALQSAAEARQNVQLFKDAVVAYDQVLKADPYDKPSRTGGASCRASLVRLHVGDAEDFYDFMKATIEKDPRTAKSIFEQPYALAYLSENRFQRLKDEAIAGSMD
jgi:hypothetical protein